MEISFNDADAGRLSGWPLGKTGAYCRPMTSAPEHGRPVSVAAKSTYDLAIGLLAGILTTWIQHYFAGAEDWVWPASTAITVGAGATATVGAVLLVLTERLRLVWLFTVVVAAAVFLGLGVDLLFSADGLPGRVAGTFGVLGSFVLVGLGVRVYDRILLEERA